MSICLMNLLNVNMAEKVLKILTGFKIIFVFEKFSHVRKVLTNERDLNKFKSFDKLGS